MSKKPILQLRDNQRTIINAEVIDYMLAGDNLSKEDMIKYGHATLTLLIAGQERNFYYDIGDGVDYKHYCDDVADIRYKLAKIGGLL